MKILYDNQITSSITITPSSENANHPFSTAFLDDRMSRFGRFLGKTSENIVLYNSAGFEFDEILVAANNMTSSATVTIQAHDSDVWTSPSVSVSMSRQTNGYYYYNWSSVQEYDYVRLVVADTTVTEDYIKIAKMFIGDALVMPGIDPSCDLYTTDNSIANENQSGQVYSDERTQILQNRFTFPDFEEPERQELKTFFATVGKHSFFYDLIWENELTKEPPYYARLLNDLNIKKITSKRFSTELEIREVK